MSSNKTGHQLIAAERQRQMDSEGWTSSHDDKHGPETLELAALCYRDAINQETLLPSQWPWSPEWWKPKSRQRNLERSGALYQAAADVAERAQNYEKRDSLRAHVASCSILLDSLLEQTRKDQ